MKAEVKRRRIVPPTCRGVVLQSSTKTDQPRKGAWPRDVVLRGFTPSSDYFDEIRQFLPGIEVYPFAGLVQIGQAPVFFALNPDQDFVIWIQPADFIIFRV